MKKNKSSFETTISEHYFAVYPFSIQFAQEYNSKFFIYFEKNLQIISRFEIPTEKIRKQEIIYFSIPQAIQHFRIQSDKNLQYQWSLYIRHQGSDGEDEQFAEGQKVNLKTQWSNYQNLKESLQEVSLSFSNMKCQLQFLLVIGNSNKDVLSSAQKHFGDKQSVLTATEKVQTSKIIEIQKNEENFQINNKNPQQKKIKEKLSAPEETIQSCKVVEPQQIKEVHQKESVQKESLIIKTPDQNQQNIPELFQNPQNTQKEINPKPSTRASLQPFDEKPNYQVQLKLSNSELDLCNQIEEEIKQSQNGRQNHSGQMTIIQQNFGKNLNSEFLPEPVNSNQNQEKSILMTNSQLLNEKGEVIIPFYKNKIIIILIVAVVIAIIGAVLLRNSILPAFPQIEDKEGTGEVKTNVPNQKRAQKLKGQEKIKGAKLQKTEKQGKSEKAGKSKQKSGKSKK